MKKIIFLDIDGVLATPEYLKDGHWAISPDKQQILKHILEQTGAEIVLSSSWRTNDLESTKTYMAKNGFLFSDKLIGITIKSYFCLKENMIDKIRIPRGVEIDQWLSTNILSDNFKTWNEKKLGRDYNYVILDDEDDMLYSQRNNFVRTNYNTGLTLELANKCIEILNKK